MTKITMRHDLPCTPEQFWEAFFDPEINERMYIESVGANDFTLVEQSGDIEGGFMAARTERDAVQLRAIGADMAALVAAHLD